MRRSVMKQGCPQALVTLAVIVLTACSDTGSGLTAPSSVEAMSAVASPDNVAAARRPGGLTVFRFGIRGSTTEDFLAATSDAQTIANVRAQLQLAENDRGLHINGFIGRARQQANLQWSWQYLESEWRLAEISFGACDANPSAVEANLRVWMKRGTQLCPLSSYVKEELSE
ncbi:MAG TPA: hypothetical protein VM939_01095 [Gemmatimonadaceae bacterium]|nr:hypothetical protein [Gemmatimonadaceae bacterium]